MRFSLEVTMLTPVPLGGPAYWHAKGTTTIFICTLNWKIVKKPQSNLMKRLDQLAEYNCTICEPDLGSDRSSVWNFCLSSDIISQRKQCWRRSMSAVFSGYKVLSAQFTIFVPDLLCKGGIEILIFLLQSCFLTVYIFVWTWVWFLILFTYSVFGSKSY